MKVLELCRGSIVKNFFLKHVVDSTSKQIFTSTSFEVTVVRDGEGFCVSVMARLGESCDPCMTIEFEKLLDRPAQLTDFVIPAAHIFWQNSSDIQETVWEAYVAERGLLRLNEDEEGSLSALLQIESYIDEAQIPLEDLAKFEVVEK